VLWRCPQVRFLDFQKVKDAERKKAKDLFGSFDAPTELAQSIIAVRSNKASAFSGTITSNGDGKSSNVKITEEEKKRFQQLIQKARTLAEVQKLEKAYHEGRLPAGVMDGDAMDET
jgi:U2 small nuclear ribonucleoprotein A'